MEIIKTDIQGLLIIKPKVFKDERGCFFESWNETLFSRFGLDLNFVQDNQSISNKGVLRGLHFQNPPYAQGKLVRVVKGSVLDVVVDIRSESLTYGHYFSVKLSDKNRTIFWIPEGFAHGFISLEDDTVFTYKCTSVYNKESEGSLLWNDKDLDIDWTNSDPLVSSKDLLAESFKNFESKF
tara:strand:+ start:352 stop:894 length:543 start_codon:yes stop_codon:yes gene_type:complete